MTTMVFAGGRVRTGMDDGSADWVLVDDGIVSSSGTGDAPAADREVDLDGGVLVPAFRDAHVHLPATGLYASGMDFREERSTDAIVSAFARRAERGDILFGGNFEEPLDRPLTRVDLDSAVGEKPALLARADMHSCVVSTALLDRLDLDGLEGVDREDRVPTGYLREQAASTAWRWFDSSLTAGQQKRAVLDAVRIAYSKGIAEVHEMFVVEWRGWDSAEAFLETIADVVLTVVPYLATTDVERVQGLGLDRIGGDWFLDGSFGSCTAWMRDPYLGEIPSGSSPTGISYRDDEEVYDFFRRAQDAGMQVGVHAIGDAAIDQALRGWQRVAEEVGPQRWGIGHRIEHFECAHDEHIARAVELKIRGSVQPAFDRFWGGEEGMYASRIGWERARGMNRFRKMLDAGLDIGGGSDSTVTPLDPFLQMTALRRHHVAEQSLGPLQALVVMTSGAAALAPDVGRRGSIETGAWADLALLDRDPLETDPDELLKTEVLGTWVKGRRVLPEEAAE